MYNLVTKELCDVSHTTLIWHNRYITFSWHWCKILVVTDLKWLQSSNSCHTVTGNTGHRLLSKGNRKSHNMINSSFVAENMYTSSGIAVPWNLKCLQRTQNVCVINLLSGWFRHAMPWLYWVVHNFKVSYRSMRPGVSHSVWSWYIAPLSW